jgi:hypothetical protein
MVRKIILAGFVVFLPTGVQAQGRGAPPPVFHSVAAAPRAVASVPHVGIAAAPGPRVIVRSGVPRSRVAMPIPRNTRRVTTRNRNADNEFGMRSDCSSAPGFGFDAVHQAATCGPGAVGSGRRGLQVPLFFPFFNGGFFLPGSAAAVEEEAAAEAPQDEFTEAEVRERSRRYRAAHPVTVSPAPVTAVETASATPPDNDEFVFVRRDGTVFFAMAYSWEKGTLRYVTSQGLRQTVTQDVLDLDATRQFNEQRGLNFRSPA